MYWPHEYREIATQKFDQRQFVYLLMTHVEQQAPTSEVASERRGQECEEPGTYALLGLAKQRFQSNP
jgi:hypothetical protein